jgi:acyl dehydratase
MGVPQEVTIDALSVGQDFGEVVFGPVGRDDFVRYAHASGDDNPIHQDEDYARDQGAPTVFAMGMLNAGYLAHAMSDWFGGPHHIRRYKTRFTARVWPGDELACTGKISAIENGVVTLGLEARRRGKGPPALGLDEEQVAIVGEAEVVLPEQAEE